MDDASIADMRSFRALRHAHPPELELSSQLNKLVNCVERMHIVARNLNTIARCGEALQTPDGAFIAPEVSCEGSDEGPATVS